MPKKEGNEKKQKKDKKEGKRKDQTRTTNTRDGDEAQGNKKSQNVSSLKAIENQPPSKTRLRLQMKNKYHTVSQELCKAPEFALFGDDIPVIDEGYEYKVGKSKLKIVFEKGYIIKGESQDFRSRSYKVVRKLTRGRNVYIVADAAHEDRTYFMKAEVATPMPRDSNIGREIILLKNSCKTDEKFRDHFLKLIDVGKIDEKYNFFVTRIGGQNLVEVRDRLNGEFSRLDAVRLCMQTLQAVHDVHLCCFIHRDIQPKNFVVGMTETDQDIVYIVNFGFSFEYYPSKSFKSLLAKHSRLSRTFQTRAFHTGSEFNRLSDLESWLYLCFWFFNSKCLPWQDIPSHEERKISNYKDMFFHGHFDLSMTKQYNLPKFLWVMRDKINTDSLPADHGPINYPFYADAIISVENQLNVDWKAPYQWQSPDAKPAKGSTEDVDVKVSAAKKESSKKQAKKDTRGLAEDAEVKVSAAKKESSNKKKTKDETEEKPSDFEMDDKSPADIASSSDDEKP